LKNSKKETLRQLQDAPIVLVEDSSDDAFFVKSALAKAHISNPIMVFEAARQARRHFELRRSDLPVLLIIDIHLLGVESGIDFLRWVRQQRAPLGTTPAMMLTGSTRSEDQDEAEMLGSVFFLIKPATADAVTSAVQSLALEVSTRGSSVAMRRTIERRT
jgi:DNA-binding response OmpR family regulator